MASARTGISAFIPDVLYNYWYGQDGANAQATSSLAQPAAPSVTNNVNSVSSVVPLEADSSTTSSAITIQKQSSGSSGLVSSLLAAATPINSSFPANPCSQMAIHHDGSPAATTPRSPRRLLSFIGIDQATERDAEKEKDDQVSQVNIYSPSVRIV
jgi:hypothetical protein